MARIASFLSRATVRAIAQEAYRLALTRAIYTSTRTIDGIVRHVDVDMELNAVFISWNDPTHGRKSTSINIAKSWGV